MIKMVSTLYDFLDAALFFILGLINVSQLHFFLVKFVFCAIFFSLTDAFLRVFDISHHLFLLYIYIAFFSFWLQKFQPIKLCCI